MRRRRRVEAPAARGAHERRLRWYARVMTLLSAIPELAARAGVTDVHVFGQPEQTVVRWQLYGLLFVSRIRPNEPVLHVTEAPGALRSSFAFAGHGAFQSNDPELVTWLAQQPAAAQLAAFVGAPVPWIVQARPRGTVTRLACLDGTQGLFQTALAILGAAAGVLPRGASWPEQAFGYPCDADALFEGVSTPPSQFRAGSFAGTAEALKDMALVQRVVQAVVPTGPKGGESARFNEAYRLIPNQKFTEAVAAFEALAREFPHRADDCASQIGAALYFLGRYEEAIAHYRKALELGADRAMMNDNIVEAEEAIRKRR